MEAISLCKEKFSDEFVRTVISETVPPVNSKMLEQIEKSGIFRVLEYFSEKLGQDFLKDMKRSVEEFSSRLNWIAMMRSSEETWEVKALDIKPSGHESSWTDAIEISFKTDLIHMFTEKLVGNVDKLLVQLSKYYSSVLNEFLDSFGSQKAVLEQQIRNNPDIPLPKNLLTGEDMSPDEMKKIKLIQYFMDIADIEKSGGKVRSILSA